MKVGDLLRPTSRLPHFALRLHPSEQDRAPSKTRIFDDGVPLDSPILPWLPHAMLRHLKLHHRGANEDMFKCFQKPMNHVKTNGIITLCVFTDNKSWRSDESHVARAVAAKEKKGKGKGTRTGKGKETAENKS